ncbi:hypothetical protein PGN35_004055 [Nodosilinea sp. PGN35]|uniref:hypothetical protein n=1 Tax=Nodosilinea sp. PGN35 TaxID=3020489 RepID=UPI0023B2CBC3|nr:hypothetical protein [Nodosilinea sp. TSF1-S3]MDF0365793.1 hypothetical protein [Nodosilinea sp. TSF1-S3]
MVRIKGANSDYTYVGSPAAAPIRENKRASPLYLEIFLCPNDMPSSVEAPHEGHWCQGTDGGCPAGEHRQAGHAKIRLDQHSGITLSARDTPALRVSERQITAAIAVDDQPEVIHLAITPAGIHLQTPDGASIQLSGSAITLTPGPASQVTINGSLTVNGDLSLTGQIHPSPSLPSPPHPYAPSPPHPSPPHPTHAHRPLPHPPQPQPRPQPARPRQPSHSPQR